jgi:GNAT superfamily N-acetyltransferase
VLSLATLHRPHLDESVAARGGACVRIVERPGRWMSAAALDQLLTDLHTIVRAATPAGTVDYGVASGDRARLDDAIITLVYDRAGVPLAFNALTLLDCELRGRPVEVLHLGLVMVDPSHRTGGLAHVLYGLTAFLLFARRRLRPLWISNVTQVPAVFGMVSEAFANVYPTRDADARQSYDHLHLARQIMARHRRIFGVGIEAEYDERRAIIRNAYTGGADNLKKSFDDAPKHRTERYNDVCRDALDYDRGDDFLQLGQVTLAAARRFFTRSSPSVSPIAFTTRFALLALESLVAPVIQWFAADTPMGDLRPSRPRRAARRMTT